MCKLAAGVRPGGQFYFNQFERRAGRPDSAKPGYQSVIDRQWFWAPLALVGSTLLCGPALAQRADENAVTTAEDAFGTRVGNESSGLYDPRNARGFDPQQAGNIRLEGMYFDQQATFGPRLQRSSSMRIGLSAQSYPFPAPTGIADISLILPGDKRVISAVAQYQTPSGSRSTALDINTPLIDGKLGLAGGINYMPGISDYLGKNTFLTVAALFKWMPVDGVEIIPLAYYNQILDSDAQPLILPGGAYLPPRIDRSVFFGQKWASRRSNDRNFGVIARGALSPTWRLQMGLFKSDQERLQTYSILYRNTQPNGNASLDFLRSPPHRFASASGEVRLSGVFTDGQYRHTVHIAARGRDTDRVFGGVSTVNVGPAVIGVYRPVARPVFRFGPRDEDVVRQISPGITYVGQWARVGEFSVGVQKSFYRRSFGREGLTPTKTSSEPWLYNGTLAVYPTTDLAFYAGYTRGLEEFGAAPDNAANSGAPMPAGLTSQVDGGIRYRLMPGVNFVAGVFEVKKPYFDRDPANIFTNVGNLSHRGVEMSLSGQVMPGLTVVAGAVFLKARVTGSSVDRGLIGEVPAGVSPRIFRFNVQYGPSSWHGLSVDAQVDASGSHNANRANTYRIPSAQTLDLGGRYSFTVMGTKANVRVQIRNVTNAYDWTADGASGRVAPTAPRRYNIRLGADF